MAWLDPLPTRLGTGKVWPRPNYLSLYGKGRHMFGVNSKKKKPRFNDTSGAGLAELPLASR